MGVATSSTRTRRTARRRPLAMGVARAARGPSRQPALRPRRAGQARRRRAARLAAGARRRASRRSARGSGRLELAELDRVEGQPADRPRDGQPRLAAPVRPRPRADRRTTSAPPASRRRHPELLDHLAVTFMDDGWSREEADPPARAEPRLPARLEVRRDELRGRPGQRAASGG